MYLRLPMEDHEEEEREEEETAPSASTFLKKLENLEKGCGSTGRRRVGDPAEPVCQTHGNPSPFITE